MERHRLAFWLHVAGSQTALQVCVLFAFFCFAFHFFNSLWLRKVVILKSLNRA